MVDVRAPFDPAEPFDAMADSIKRQVADIADGMQAVAVFRDMDGRHQLQCLMAGLTVGLIGVCFAHIRPSERDTMMNIIVEYLPQAREVVEQIIGDAEAPAHG